MSTNSAFKRGDRDETEKSKSSLETISRPRRRDRDFIPGF